MLGLSLSRFAWNTNVVSKSGRSLFPSLAHTHTQIETHTHTQTSTYQWKPNLITIPKTRTQSERSADKASAASVSTPRIPLEYSSSLPEHTKKKIEQRLNGVGIGRRQSKHSHMFTRTLTNIHSLIHSLTHAIALSFPIRIEISFEFALNVCFVTTCGSPTLCLPSSLALVFAPYTYLYILYMVYGIWALAYSRHIVALAHFDAWLGWRTLWSSWLLS